MQYSKHEARPPVDEPPLMRCIAVLAIEWPEKLATKLFALVPKKWRDEVKTDPPSGDKCIARYQT